MHGLRTRTVFGGVGQNPQVQAIRQGVDIVIACPGRLEDLIQQGHVDLGSVEVTVLDEADHMADLGFLPAVRRLLDQTPRGGQRMLFSATLDSGVNVLVKRFLDNPATHEADSAQSPISTMDHHVLHVHRDHRVAVLVDLASAPGRTVVFTRTKHGAKNLARQLNSRGVPTVELHGNLAQNARTRNMEAFHSGSATTLVATDIAARGIHVDDVALVVHADPPAEHKAYLHRSGRTARAGAAGHGHHADDRPAGQGRPGPHPRREDLPDHDEDLRPEPPDARAARAGRAGAGRRWPEGRPARAVQQNRRRWQRRRTSSQRRSRPTAAQGGSGVGRGPVRVAVRPAGSLARPRWLRFGCAPSGGGHSAAGFSSSRRGR